MVLGGGAALGQDAVRLTGEMLIGGATLVDPPPGEAKSTHAYLTVTGLAALRLYRSMSAQEEDDLCRGDGRKLKRAGTLSCSIAAGGREAVCDFGVDLRSGAMSGGPSAQAADVSLFKIVSAKDDMIVGLTRDELAKFGPGVPLEVFATELQRRGQMPVWQYASTRGAQGELVMSPLQRIIVLYPGTARIEPYTSNLKVVPPAAR